MLIDRRELIVFFDERGEARSQHAKAIKEVAGEELGLHLLIDFFRRQDKEANVLEERCTTGKSKGFRLDGWVKVADRALGMICYQVEVKTWSVHSLHGRPLSLSASPSEIATFKKERWKRYWHGDHFHDPKLNKVLTPMKPPSICANVQPLACLWDAVHPSGGSEPFFVVPFHGEAFEQVSVFSMSAFLRSLDEPIIDLALPCAGERLHWLKRIFPEAA